MSDLVSILLTTLHFVAVNAAVGGPLLCLWLERRAARGDRAAAVLGRALLRTALVGLYAGAALGVGAAYLWWQSVPAAVEQAYFALPTRRYFGLVAELAFSAICWEIWLRCWRSDARPRLRWWLGFVGATNVVYHFPALFAMLSVLSTRPPQPAGSIRFVGLLLDPEVFARALHFVVASIALAGAVLMRAAARRTPIHDVGMEQIKRRGAQIALVATLLQWPIGIAVLVALPATSRDGLLGGDVLTATLFGVSLGAVVVLMHKLAAAAFGKTTTRDAASALAWLGLAIVLMTAVRHYARKPLYPADHIGIMQAEHTSGTFTSG